MRYQLGDYIPLEAHFQVESFGPLRPDIAVLATIVEMSTGTVIETVYLHPINIFRTPERFALRLPTNNSLYSAGHYGAYFTTQVGGRLAGYCSTFEIVNSGDSGGAVIGMVDYQFQTGEHAVFQKDSGLLMVGRKPQ